MKFDVECLMLNVECWLSSVSLSFMLHASCIMHHASCFIFNFVSLFFVLLMGLAWPRDGTSTGYVIFIIDTIERIAHNE